LILVALSFVALFSGAHVRLYDWSTAGAAFLGLVTAIVCITAVWLGIAEAVVRLLNRWARRRGVGID
jgi:hypothetical protein